MYRVSKMYTLTMLSFSLLQALKVFSHTHWTTDNSTTLEISIQHKICTLSVCALHISVSYEMYLLLCFICHSTITVSLFVSLTIHSLSYVVFTWITNSLVGGSFGGWVGCLDGCFLSISSSSSSSLSSSLSSWNWFF